VDVVYTYQVVGQFHDDKLTAQFSNPLNWLPENTYTVPPIIRRYNAQGQPVTPTPLLPTTNSAGYVMQPPLALTTLAAAVQLKGDHVISAIRVRVAGVDRANPDSWKRIQQVAGEIEQRLHLPVVVMLGSSPQPVLVSVPGVKQGQLGAKQDIAPVGWVEERWIHIGAAIVYLGQLGETRLLLLGAILLVCLGYLLVTFNALISAQRRHMAVLSALGWRPWHPIRLFLLQTLLLSLLGGIAGIGLALLIIILIGASPPWDIVVWTLPIILAFALLSILYPLVQLWHVRPAEVLRADSSILAGRVSQLATRIGWALPTLVALALRNVTRARIRALIAVSSLFFSAGLLTIMFAGILALRQTLQGTLLGDYVLLQTAVPQIAGCVFALLITFFSVADLLLLQVQERQREIGLLRAVGWRPGIVRRLFVQEGVTLALLVAVPGGLEAVGAVGADRGRRTPTRRCGSVR